MLNNGVKVHVASYLLSYFPLFHRVLLVYCHICRAKRITDYPPNVSCIEECELQHLNTGPGSYDADRCSSGGCESDRTSTTSFLGSDGTTSSNGGESEPQTTPVRPHTESGQQGAASAMLSKDVLPLHHTQLSPEQVCQQYYSRKLDNEDKHDANKKGYAFAVEGNNSQSSH